jgi:hypothetical protein
MMSKAIVIVWFILFLAAPAAESAATKAIIFGTTDYASGDDLPSCAQDAEDMHHALISSGVVKKPDSLFVVGENSKALMQRFVEETGSGLKEGDTLIFFNSGHGSEDGRICAYDADVSPDELSSWLAKSKCSNVLILNDSCYSGKFKVSIPGKKVVQINSSNPARISYTSSLKTAGLGHKNGVFTKYFMQALDPANSDRDKDGNITAMEILLYVNKNMFVDEHKSAEEYARNRFAEHYNKSVEQLKAEMSQALGEVEYWKKAGDEKEAENWLAWYRIYEWLRDLKLGEEGERWQEPTLIGDGNFVVVGAGNWQACLLEEMRAQRCNCKIYPRPGEEPVDYFCQAEPLKIKRAAIEEFKVKYNLGGKSYAGMLKVLEERLAVNFKLYFQRAEEINSVEAMRNFAATCGDCKIQLISPGSEGKEAHNYMFVCKVCHHYTDRPSRCEYEPLSEAWACEKKWEEWKERAFTKEEAEKMVIERTYLHSLISLLKSLQKCRAPELDNVTRGDGSL